MQNQEPPLQPPTESANQQSTAVNKNLKTSRQIFQSSSAIIASVVIIAASYFFAILFSALPGVESQAPIQFLIFPSAIIDLFICINLLSGKYWARTWMLVRLIVGCILWGGIYSLQGNLGGLILALGEAIPPILLLTGISTRVRVIGSISLAIVGLGVGLLWDAVIVPSISLRSLPETFIISNSFSTYSSPGFFNISYPKDWLPLTSKMAEIEADMKRSANARLGIAANQVNSFQLLFAGGKETNDGDFHMVQVTIQPKDIWPLASVVESTYVLGKKSIPQFIEFSRIKTRIGGREAIIQTGQYSEENYLIGYMSAYILARDHIWIVNCACDSNNLATNLNTFDQVVRSLRVEQ
jgi:hypothetical protein